MPLTWYLNTWVLAYFFMAVQILITFHFPVVLCLLRKASWVSGQPRHFETLSSFRDNMLLGKRVLVRDVCAQI